MKQPCFDDLDYAVQGSCPLHALYHPELHTEFFVSAISVSDWLCAIFGVVFGDTHYLCSFIDNYFIVCNLPDRSTICLSSLDVSSSIFHPRSLLSTFNILEYAESHPVWFYFQKSHYLSSLIQLPLSDLLTSAKSMEITCKIYTKKALSLCIFHEFLAYRYHQLIVSPHSLSNVVSL